MVRQRPRYEWLYVHAFVRPSDGETFWLFLPTVSVEVFQLALEEFAKAVDAGPDHHVLLVLDGAGWHTSKRLRLPEGIHLLFLPAYSPELQPAERLWPLLRESIANRTVENLDQLEARLTHRVKAMMRRPELIAGLTGFHWWTEAVRSIV